MLHVRVVGKRDVACEGFWQEACQEPGVGSNFNMGWALSMNLRQRENFKRLLASLCGPCGESSYSFRKERAQDLQSPNSKKDYPTPS